MNHPTDALAPSAGTTQQLERYADRSRPPTPWVFVVAGITLGAMIVMIGLLPGAWGVLPVAVVGAAGVGYDRWLLRHHGVPRLRDLPAAVRREQWALIIVAGLVGLLPLILIPLVAGFPLTAGAATSGIAVAILLGIGGPIVDRRARSTAAELLEHQHPNGPESTFDGDRKGSR